MKVWGLPMTERSPCFQTLAIQSTAAKTGHLRRGRRLVDEDQPMRARLAVQPPASASLADIIAPAFRSHQSFFYVKPAASSARDSEAGWATAFVSTSSFVASSGMVMSGLASTQRINFAMCGASLSPPGGRPWRPGATEPVVATCRAS